LIEFLPTILNENNPNRYLIICGDIAYHHNPEEYTEALTEINRLLDAIPIERANLLICPGNHDILQNPDNVFYPPSYELTKKYLTFVNIENPPDAFGLYVKLCQDLKIPQYDIYKNNSYLTGCRNFENISFVALNSSWFSRDSRYDKKRMIIGEKFLDTIVTQNLDLNNKMKILFFHHPFRKWIMNREIRDISSIIQNFELLITGHVHPKDPMIGITPGKRPVELSMGAFYLPKLEHNGTLIKCFRTHFDIQWIKWANNSLIIGDPESINYRPQSIPSNSTPEFNNPIEGDE
jgi:calcineurin-like phosphoesterase family protein